MRVSATFGPDGKIQREVDFQGATLPDGRSIQATLDENETLKRKVSSLQREIDQGKSILSWIPSRKVKIAVEAFLIAATIVSLFFMF